MQFEFLVSIVAALTSLLAGGVASLDITRRVFDILIGKKKPQPLTYAQRLSELTSNLHNATIEVDQILTELSQVAKERENAVQQLEHELSSLESREKQLKDKIDLLEKVPIQVVDHFAQIIQSGERRNAWRDYLLFGAGVVASTVLTLVLKAYGVG